MRTLLLFVLVLVVFPATAQTPVPRADFNGDGRHDIVWRNKSTGQVWVTLMDGLAATGGFLLHTEPNTDWGINGAADFNGDGNGDVLWRRFALPGELFMQLFIGGGLLQTALPWTESDLNWNVWDVQDFDGDGKADILYRNVITGRFFGILMDYPSSILVRSTTSPISRGALRRPAMSTATGAAI